MRAPRTIRQHGRVYEMTAHSLWDEILQEKYRESEEIAWPPRVDRTPISSAQRTMIQRIAACPVPIHWSGVLYHHGARADIPFAPHISQRTVACLWRKGMLTRNKKKRFEGDTITLSERGREHEMPTRVAYERLRWQAIIECGADLAVRWEAYRNSGCLDNRPYQRPTEREIRDKTRVVYEREKAVAP